MLIEGGRLALGVSLSLPFTGSVAPRERGRVG